MKQGNLPLYSQRKQRLLTDYGIKSGSGIQKVLFNRQPSILRTPRFTTLQSHNSGDISHRFVPKNIIYDKQTLYEEVHQLKLALNRLVDENTKLKTKLSVKASDKLNRSMDQSQLEGIWENKNESVNHQKRSKGESKYQTLNMQIRVLMGENLDLQTELKKVKKMMRYTEINQLQQQNKAVVDLNRSLSKKIEELYRKVEMKSERIQQCEASQKKLVLVTNEMNIYKKEIQSMHIEMMNLQGEIKRQKDHFLGRENKLYKTIAEEKTKNVKNLRGLGSIHNDQGVTTGIGKREEKLRHTSFKSHRLRVQPIRTQHIGNRQSSLLDQEESKELGKSVEDGLRLRLEEVEVKLRQAEDKLLKIENGKVTPKPSNVHTNFSDNTFKDPQNERQTPRLKQESEEVIQKEEKQKEQLNQNIITQNQGNQQTLSGSTKIVTHVDMGVQVDYIKVEIQNKVKEQKTIFQKESEQESRQEGEIKVDIGSEHQIDSEKGKPKQIFKVTGTVQSQSVPMKIQKSESQTSNVIPSHDYESNDQKKYHTELYYPNDQESQSPKLKKTLTSKNKQSQKYVENQSRKQKLKDIKTMLTYRMKYQNYTFQDLRGDIQHSKVEEFSFTDLCEMLVDKPFYLGVRYSKMVLRFVFERERPGEGDKIGKERLIVKLRRLIEDFEAVKIQKQAKIAQNAAKVVHNHSTIIQQMMKNSSNGPSTILLSKFIQILSRCELSVSQIEFLVTQTAIYSQDLEHINYGVLFERLLSESTSVKESQLREKTEVILQQEDEENSYMGKTRIDFQQKEKKKQKFPEEKLIKSADISSSHHQVSEIPNYVTAYKQ